MSAAHKAASFMSTDEAGADAALSTSDTQPQDVLSALAEAKKRDKPAKRDKHKPPRLSQPLSPDALALLLSLVEAGQPLQRKVLFKQPRVKAMRKRADALTHHLQALRARGFVGARGRATTAVWFVPEGATLPQEVHEALGTKPARAVVPARATVAPVSAELVTQRTFGTGPGEIDIALGDDHLAVTVAGLRIRFRREDGGQK